MPSSRAGAERSPARDEPSRATSGGRDGRDTQSLGPPCLCGKEHKEFTRRMRNPRQAGV